MPQAQTQYDVTFFGLQSGHHDATASDIGAKLQEAGDGNWSMSWMGITTEGVILVLQRPAPPTPAAVGSLAGYGEVAR